MYDARPRGHIHVHGPRLQSARRTTLILRLCSWPAVPGELFISALTPDGPYVCRIIVRAGTKQFIRGVPHPFREAQTNDRIPILRLGGGIAAFGSDPYLPPGIGLSELDPVGSADAARTSKYNDLVGSFNECFSQYLPRTSQQGRCTSSCRDHVERAILERWNGDPQLNHPLGRWVAPSYQINSCS